MSQPWELPLGDAQGDDSLLGPSSFEDGLQPWSPGRNPVAAPHRSLSAAVSLLAHAAALVWLLQTAGLPPAESAIALTVDLVAADTPEPAPDETAPQSKAPPPVPAEPARPKPVAPPPLVTPPPPKPEPKIPHPPKPPQPVASAAPAAPPSAVAAASEDPAASVPKAAPTIPAVPEAADDSLRLYGQTLWTRIIGHKPTRIRRQGTVHLSFTLSRDGQLVDSAIATSSGSEALDQAALAALRETAPFPPPPESLTDLQLTFTIPFEFR